MGSLQTHLNFPFISRHFAFPQKSGQGSIGGHGGFLVGFPLQTHSGVPDLSGLHISFTSHFFLHTGDPSQLGGVPPLGQIHASPLHSPLHSSGLQGGGHLSVAHLHVDFSSTTTHLYFGGHLRMHASQSGGVSFRFLQRHFSSWSITAHILFPSAAHLAFPAGPHNGSAQSGGKALGSLQAQVHFPLKTIGLVLGLQVVSSQPGGFVPQAGKTASSFPVCCSLTH